MPLFRNAMGNSNQCHRALWERELQQGVISGNVSV